MTIALPPPIATFFAADAGADIEAFLGCFADDAVVTDERQAHHGRDAIRAWKTGPAAQYDYVTAPFAFAEDADGRSVVTARLTGNFPGSPVDLRYRFTLAGGLIAALEIAP
jgi:ketosteroid isomerase-like protein